MADLATAPTATTALTPPPAPPTDTPKPARPGIVETLIGNIGKGAEEARREVKALDASTMQMKPPELALPPKPKPQSTDPIEAWGSMAMVFAALASFKVRNHATAAMNAGAAALQGFQKRDQQAYDQAFKTWEVETKNAIDLAHFQQEAYKTLLNSVQHKEDLALRVGDAQDRATEAKLRTLGTALQDPGLIQALDRGGIAEAAEYQKKQIEITREFELRKASMTKKGMEGAEVLAAQPIMQSPEYKEAMEKGDLATAYGMLATVAPTVYGPMAEKAQKDKAEVDLKRQKEEESSGRSGAAGVRSVQGRTSRRHAAAVERRATRHLSRLHSPRAIRPPADLGGEQAVFGAEAGVLSDSATVRFDHGAQRRLGGCGQGGGEDQSEFQSGEVQAGAAGAAEDHGRQGCRCRVFLRSSQSASSVLQRTRRQAVEWLRHQSARSPGGHMGSTDRQPERHVLRDGARPRGRRNRQGGHGDRRRRRAR